MPFGYASLTEFSSPGDYKRCLRAVRLRLTNRVSAYAQNIEVAGERQKEKRLTRG